MSGGRTAFAVAAPAKINLYLHVTGRRADGLHLIDSFMAFTNVGDRIVARPAEDLHLDVQGRFASGLGAGEDNLVLRAARALSERVGVRPQAHITLVKNLPVASGIGGGSSDAAATLKALTALWRVDPGALLDAEWAASRLGADVPVCLFGAPAQVSGIGDIVRAAPDPPACAVVLVNPGVPVATGSVFAGRAGPLSPGAPLASVSDSAAMLRELAERRNDLTEAALSIAPVIAESLAALARADACRLARMSGSGGTCFGLFDRDAAADGAARAIAAEHPEWWVCATRFRSAPATVETVVVP